MLFTPPLSSPDGAPFPVLVSALEIFSKDEDTFNDLRGDLSEVFVGDFRLASPPV